MVRNSIIDKLPKHLRQFINDQPYDQYTSIDHAVWRYVMRQNVNHLSKVAHGSYLDGLKKTGIDIESIPHMYGMNRILKEIGWAAVAVDGFIPPSAFMEFQAYNVLVIAADIRQLKHIEYTPAPDIIHEAAGHAPIIADQEYAEYLKRFGEIGCKAISSKKDYELYEAIRHLSIIKEYPFTPKESINEAEQHIEEIQANMGEPSEMALIRRLHWWTVEYGLIGELKNPKIYGAGLLSSIGESVSCLNDDVIKLPYTIDAANIEFDITKPQPQLFVTPNFRHLTHVLEDFADTMALRTGGASGLKKAIASQSVCTIETESGIQLSGVFSNECRFWENQPWIIKTNGPSALAYANKEFEGHGKENYTDGFILLNDHIKGVDMPFYQMKRNHIEQLGIRIGYVFNVETVRGITIQGTLVGEKRNLLGYLQFLVLNNVEIRFNDTPIYIGMNFNLILTDSIRSVYSGSADKDNFKELSIVPSEHTVKVHHDQLTLELMELYAGIREMRKSEQFNESKLLNVFQKLKTNHSGDWLLSVELLELISQYIGNESSLYENVYTHLIQLSERNPELKKLIFDGLKLITLPQHTKVNL